MNPPEHEILTIPIKNILVDQNFNCRETIRPSDYMELAESIREKGLIQYPVVIPWGDNTWRLIAGYRRMLALNYLKWENVPCIIRRGLSEADALIINLSENLDRKNLNLLEEAKTVERLLKTMDIAKVATLLSRSESWLQSRLSVLMLPPSLQDEAAAGTITLKQIKTIIELPTEQQLNYVLAYKKRAENSQSTRITLAKHKIKMQRMTKGKPRSKPELMRVRDYLYTMFGPSIEVIALNWAAGEITYEDFEHAIKEQAKMFEIDYRSLEENESLGKA